MSWAVGAAVAVRSIALPHAIGTIMAARDTPCEESWRGSASFRLNTRALTRGDAAVVAWSQIHPTGINHGWLRLEKGTEARKRARKREGLEKGTL
jgi:hypothetical protein